MLQKSHVVAESGNLRKTETPANRLDQVLKEALIGAAPDHPIEQLARYVVREHRDLVESYVAGLLRLERRRMQRAEQQGRQLPLPGFERIPLRIRVGDGHRRPLLQATNRDLLDYLRTLRAKQKDDPKVQQVRTLLELVGKWRRKLELKKGQLLTVAEAMEREAGQQ